jgi:hypothetical protein
MGQQKFTGLDCHIPEIQTSITLKTNTIHYLILNYLLSLLLQ